MRIYLLVFLCLFSKDIFSQKAKSEFNGKARDKVVLNFVDFKFTLFNIEVWNEDSYLSSPHKDTIEILLGLSSSITNQKILVDPIGDKVILETLQQYQTSFSVSDDGAHLDLLNWKHHTSDWKKIRYQSDTLYTIGYNTKEKSLFPSFKKSELIKEVSKEGIEKFNRRVKDLKFPIQTSDFVSISKITFKFVCRGENSYSTKILIVHLPMGC
jgi:hypothetical protein